MRATIDLFNSKRIKNKNGDVIVCKYLSTTQVDRKSLLAIAGGQPPELAGFWLFNNHLFADMGAVMPLDDYIARDNKTGGFDTDHYLPVFWEGCRHRGKTWSLPTTPATVALHWNKEMFAAAGLDPDRPPRTITEMEEYNVKLTKKDPNGKVISMGFLPPEPGWWNWGWGYFFGGKLNDGLEKITATDPKNIEALTWVTSFNKGYKPEQLMAFRQSFGASFDSPQNAFLSGKVAMVLQGVWMANYIRFHKPQMKWGCGAFPTSFDNQGEPVTFADMDVISIPRGCKHPDEAWEVIKFLNTHEGMEYVCGSKENNGGQGKLTAFKENTPGWIDSHLHPHLRVFIDMARSKNARSIPKLAVWNEYGDELRIAFERAWLNEVSAEQALKDVQARMQPKLDRALKIQNARMNLK